MEEKKMPLKVRRFCTSILLVLFSFIAAITAQTLPAASTTPAPQATVPQTNAPVKTPTAGEVMRDRISKAKAFIAVRNYNAAIYELESIRRESNDVSVHAVTNVLLMNSYLEQGDYKRAQDFLTEFFNANKSHKPNASANYFAIAGQVVKGARNRVERYRALGLNVSDRNLPLEAVSDIEKMRETLELVVTQSKEIGKDKNKTPDAMALLEEAGNSRSVLARDDYDARRWRDEVSDTREQITSSRSVVINAVNDSTGAAPVIQDAVATNVSEPNQQPTGGSPAPADSGPVFKPVAEQPINKPAPSETQVAASKPIIVGTAKEEPKKAEEAPKQADEDKAKETAQPKKMLVIDNGEKEKADEKTESTAAAAGSAGHGSPLEVGSLIGYATRQAQPVYPAAARSMRATGTVKVEVMVDEAGDVSEVQKASGHSLLQGAARDAIRKWKFKPFVRDGQPVKATGFVTFNFSL
jgi:protein TonB